MKTFITTNQLCERLQVTRPYVLQCRKRGLPTIPLGVGKKSPVRFDFDEVVQWLKETNERRAGA
jgi:phage terminase Nu1 subunit (DNA packaging protein)